MIFGGPLTAGRTFCRKFLNSMSPRNSRTAIPLCW